MVSVFASLFRGCLDGRKLGFHLCLHVWSVMMCFSVDVHEENAAPHNDWLERRDLSDTPQETWGTSVVLRPHFENRGAERRSHCRV